VSPMSKKSLLIWAFYLKTETEFSLQKHILKKENRSMDNVEQLKKKTPWSESASELYRPRDRRLSAK
jgi:hypothetical protein